MKKLFVGILALASLGACGGQSESEQIADCREGFRSVYASAGAARNSIPRAAWEETGRRICVQAVDEHLLTGGESDEEIASKLEAFVKDHPDALHPICVASAVSQFSTLEPSEQTPEIRAAFREFGRRYCDAAIDDGLFTVGSQPTDEELNAVFSRHPSISNGLCVASGLQEFKATPFVVRGETVSLEHQKLFLSLFCHDVADAGLFTVSGDFTPAQQRQLAEIFEHVRREMVASGELP